MIRSSHFPPRIIWEAKGVPAAYAETFTFTPGGYGAQWVEAEAQWPDGRRVVATATFTANSPTVVWVDDVIPAGSLTQYDVIRILPYGGAITRVRVGGKAIIVGDGVIRG